MTAPIAPGKVSLSPPPPNSHQKIDRDKVDPTVLAAAQGMESMFLNMVMQAMRKTVPESEFSMNSNATKIYQNMMDGEFVEAAAKNGGIGLADQIIAYFEAAGYNQKREIHSQPVRTGGTDEGQ